MGSDALGFKIQRRLQQGKRLKHYCCKWHESFMGLAAELQPLWSLASFLTYGPQISENWPRTIRATVPQLLWDVQIQTLFGDICRIINHHCGNSLFIMYEVRGYRVQWLRSKIHIIWRNLDHRLYGFNGIMVKTLNQAAIGKTNENSCKPSSQTSLFLSNFRLLDTNCRQYRFG